MSYIGNEPIVSATRTVTEITATAGQTVFTANGGYTVGYLDVFVNGSKLTNTDFTATNGTTVTLNEAAQAGDIVRLEALGTFLTSSGLTANNPNYTGTLTGGTGVVNIGSGQFYKDASGNVGIGTSSPNAKVQIETNAASNPIVTVTASSTSQGFAINPSAGGIGWVGMYTNHPLGFYTNNTERMRIDSSGNLLVGLTSSTVTGAPTRIGVNFTGAVNYGLSIVNTNTSTGTAINFVNNSNSQVGAINCSTTTTSYNTSSDYRLKENIAPITGALAKVQALKPCTYKWKVDGSDGQGFIAHELKEVVPDCVTGEKDAVDVDGNPVYQGIDTSFLVATLTAAIQEQQAIINDLKARIESLENK